MKQILCLLLCVSALLAKPEWIDSRPVDNLYYIGIGRATIGSGISKDELLTVAKDRALSDLISQISVSIRATSGVSSEATNETLEETYFEQILLETKTDLTGHEFVDQYKKRKDAWVYYRLKKSTWKSIEQQRLSKAIDIYKAHLSEALHQVEKGVVVSAITRYISAYESLIPVLYLTPRASIDGRDQILAVHCKESLQALLSQVTFSHAYPLFHGVRKRFETSPPKIQVTYNNRPIAEYPILLKKAALVVPANGLYITTKAFSSDTMIVPVTTNSAQISPLIEQSVLIKKWVSTLRWPQSSLQIIFRKPTILIQSMEEHLDMEADNKALKPVIEDFFSTNGFGLAVNPSDTELLISLKGNTRTISGYGSLHFVYMDVTATIYDAKGKTLFSKKFKPIKDGGLDFEQASVNAYQKGAPIIAKALLEWCNANF